MPMQCVEPLRPIRVSSRGFTLIELLVALAILDLLVGLTGPRVMNALGASKTNTARAIWGRARA